MRTVPMCFSLLQVGKCRLNRLVNLWNAEFHGLSGIPHGTSYSKVVSSKIYGLERGQNKRWTRRLATTKTEMGNKPTISRKPSDIRTEILDESVSTSCTIKIHSTEKSQFQKLQYFDVQKVAENKDLANLVTVIVFDVETTGFSRDKERIIEIALQDLAGGRNSTFQTLVNPERYVPNAHLHGITTHMVNRPDVPRMVDLIPILLRFIGSREKPGGYVLLVAHNARTFDVPFLLNEFNRCSFEFPSNWLFVDTLPLAREYMKSAETGSKLSSKVSLQALREHLRIPLNGSAHRAMSDVSCLSLILQRMTFDLKLTVSGLVERYSFRASDLNKKKKN